MTELLAVFTLRTWQFALVRGYEPFVIWGWLTGHN